MSTVAGKKRKMDIIIAGRMYLNSGLLWNYNHARYKTHKDCHGIGNIHSKILYQKESFMRAPDTPPAVLMK